MREEKEKEIMRVAININKKGENNFMMKDD
jgi:hypothetical protein